MAAMEQGIKIVQSAVGNLQGIFIWRSHVKVIIVWLVFVTGSFFHDFFPLPSCYLSHKRNIFNVFFVKKGWGWTCGMLTFYIVASLMTKKIKDPKQIRGNVLRLFYLTAVWYFATSVFEYIENLTGFCEGEVSIANKTDCSKQRSRWFGFDISGHCFLLTYCILILNEELQGFVSLKDKIDKRNAKDEKKESISLTNLTTNSKHFHFMDTVSMAMTLLMILWEFMLVLTCLYYHTVYQKVLGTVFGILAWHFIYNIMCKVKHPLAPAGPLNFN